MNISRSALTTLLLSATLTAGIATTANACTRAFMNMYPDYMVSARNLDFFGPVDPSMVITPKGIQQTGGNGSDVAHWTTRYGTVMIYADGVFPMDGINEAGLAGHTLFYTNGSQIQQDNKDKPVLQSVAWLSWILQQHASVADVVKSLDQVRLKAAKLPIDYASDTKHIAIEDKSGDSAIIEIDNGKVHIYHDKNYRVMTNPPAYQKQLQELERYKNADRDAIPGNQHADSRLIRASFHLKHLPKPDNKQQAQGFIQSVVNNVAYPMNYPAGKEEQEVVDAYAKYSKYPEYNKGIGTYWSTISDLSHGEYHFKSAFASSEIYVKLQEINFSAGQPVKRIDHINDYAQNSWEGNILSHFIAAK